MSCDLLGKTSPTGSAVSSVFCPGAVNSSVVLILVASGCCLWVVVGIFLGTNTRVQSIVGACCTEEDEEEVSSSPQEEAGLSVGVSMTKGALDEGDSPNPETVVAPQQQQVGQDRGPSAQGVWEPASLGNGRGYEVNRLTGDVRWVEEEA